MASSTPVGAIALAAVLVAALEDAPGPPKRSRPFSALCARLKSTSRLKSVASSRLSRFIRAITSWPATWSSNCLPWS